MCPAFLVLGLVLVLLLLELLLPLFLLVWLISFIGLLRELDLPVLIRWLRGL